MCRKKLPKSVHEFWSGAARCAWVLLHMINNGSIYSFSTSSKFLVCAPGTSVVCTSYKYSHGCSVTLSIFPIFMMPGMEASKEPVEEDEDAYEPTDHGEDEGGESEAAGSDDEDVDIEITGQDIPTGPSEPAQKIPQPCPTSAAVPPSADSQEYSPVGMGLVSGVDLFAVFCAMG